MPAPTPDIKPLDEPIVAIVVLLLLQLPPPVPFVIVAVWLTHIDVGPPMAVGAAVTDTTLVTKLPPAV